MNMFKCALQESKDLTTERLISFASGSQILLYILKEETDYTTWDH